MRKVLKWIGIVLGSLLGLLVVIVIGLLIYGQISYKPVQANRPLYEIQADRSPEGMARGKYLVESVMGCTGACHSPSPEAPFTGRMENVNLGPAALEFNAPNLTPDQQTGLGAWTDAEIARAIREGVDREGRALVVMPASNYHVLSDADMAAILGYLRSLPPTHNEIKPFRANAFGKVMLIPNILIPASLGTPITSAQTTPTSGTPEYGAYLVSIAGCKDCHKPNLAGGSTPDGGLPSPNLTPGGELGQWSEADFLTAMHTGLRPDGRRLSPDMPYKEYGKMTDEDLLAIFSYLRSLDAVASK
jgi:mono/diheme cytochrome c family protein